MLSAVLLIFSLLTPTSYQDPVSVPRSNILEELVQRKKNQPAITLKELAVVGNELLENRGFDYMFDVCDIFTFPKGVIRPSDTATNYDLSLTNGEKKSLRFTVMGDYGGMCGECLSLIPSLQVTKKKMVLIADGNRYRVRRPASFELDEVELLDAKMKKVLRTWQLPYQAIPLGISSDGVKVYIDPWRQELDGLVVELSKDGGLAFRARSEVRMIEGTVMKDHPKDPKNAYLTFIRFSAGKKTFIIRFSAPCT